MLQLYYIGGDTLVLGEHVESDNNGVTLSDPYYLGADMEGLKIIAMCNPELTIDTNVTINKSMLFSNALRPSENLTNLYNNRYSDSKIQVPKDILLG